MQTFFILLCLHIIIISFTSCFMCLLMLPRTFSIRGYCRLFGLPIYVYHGLNMFSWSSLSNSIRNIGSVVSNCISSSYTMWWILIFNNHTILTFRNTIIYPSKYFSIISSFCISSLTFIRTSKLSYKLINIIILIKVI